MAERKSTPNPYRIEGDVAILSLNEGRETRIDTRDVDRVLAHRWAAYWYPSGEQYYVTTHEGGRTVYLHRFIMSAPRGTYVDHRNHDGLDNRRENLRLVTNQRNMENRSGAANSNSKTGIRGVYVHRCKPSGLLYGAKVTQGKRQFVKYFPYTPEGLAQAAEAVVQMRLALMTHSDGR